MNNNETNQGLIAVLGFLVLLTIGGVIAGMHGHRLKDEAMMELRLTKDHLRTCQALLTCRDTVVDTVTIKQDYLFIEVTGTKYQPVVGQTDDTPLNTADGSFIDTVALERGEIRWCALSQDLLWFNGGPFHYGDTVYVHSYKDFLKGTWIVHDAMNARLTKRIDFLMPIHGGPTVGLNKGMLISNMPLVQNLK
jgi:hypothetical protein